MSECNTCYGHDAVCADCSDNLTPMECAKIRIKELEKLLVEACESIECSDDFLAGKLHKENFLNKPEIKAILNKGKDGN